MFRFLYGIHFGEAGEQPLLRPGLIRGNIVGAVRGGWIGKGVFGVCICV